MPRGGLTYSPTPFDPAAFDELVGNSTAENVLEGVATGIVASLATQARVGMKRDEKARTRELATALRDSLVEQGYSEQEARAAALFYTRHGLEAIKVAITEPRQAMAEYKKTVGQGRIAGGKADVIEDSGVAQGRADVASTEAGTDATIAGTANTESLTRARDVGTDIQETTGLRKAEIGIENTESQIDSRDKASDIAGRSQSLTEWRTRFMAEITGRKQDLSEKEFYQKYDTNRDFEIGPKERVKLYRDNLKRVRDQQKKDIADWAKMPPEDRVSQQEPREAGEDELRAVAEELTQEDVERFQGDGAFAADSDFLTNGTARDTTTAPPPPIPAPDSTATPSAPALPQTQGALSAPPTPSGATSSAPLSQPPPNAQTVSSADPGTQAAIDEFTRRPLRPGITREQVEGWVAKNHPSADVQAFLKAVGF